MPPVRRMKYVRPVPYGNQARRVAVKLKQDAAVVARALVRNAPPASSLSRGYERRAGFYGRFTGPNAENKFFDTSVAFNFDLTGEVPATGQLTLIPQGVTESTRVGRKCVIKSIILKGVISNVSSAAVRDSGVLYIMLDKQTNGAAAAATDVFTSSDFTISQINLANSERFSILGKIQYNLSSKVAIEASLLTYGGYSQWINFYKKCNIPIEFSSTTGAITEIRSNNIFLLAGSGGTADDLSKFTGSCRLRFSD